MRRSVFPWTHPHLSTELGTELRKAAETALPRNLGNGQRCRKEQMAGMFDSHPDDALHYRIARCLLE